MRYPLQFIYLTYIYLTCHFTGIYDSTAGHEYAEILKNQVYESKIPIIYDEITAFYEDGKDKVMVGKKAEYRACSVIFAMGGTPKDLCIDHEKE